MTTSHLHESEVVTVQVKVIRRGQGKFDLIIRFRREAGILPVVHVGVSKDEAKTIVKACGDDERAKLMPASA